MDSVAPAGGGGGSSYSTRSGLSKSWRAVKTHAGVFTGGKVQLLAPLAGDAGATVDAHAVRIACMLHDDVALVDAATGELQRTLQRDVEDEQKESFVVFAARPGRNQLVTAGRNLLLRLWDLETLTCVRTIKAHETPVLAMDFDPTGTLLATGGSDRAVKVFDVDKGFCTHNFRGHAGIVTLVQFHPDPARLLLVSSGDDATVRVWDLYAQEQLACVREHMSPATCVAFSRDGYTLLSAGRDKVVNLWDLRDNKLAKTVLVHEAVEGLQVVPGDFACVQPEATAGGKKRKQRAPEGGTEQDQKAICFVTAGDKGLLRAWRSSGASCEAVRTQAPESDSLKYLALLLNERKRELVAVSADQNLLVFDDKLARTTQIIGYNDDILSLKYIPTADGAGVSEQMAVATNSEQIRLLNRETLSCELLSGHADIVMALAVSPDGRWLVSASKDRTARVWSVAERRCVATCAGHTEALGAVAISQKPASFATGAAFFVSGSADKTLKLWSLKTLSAAYSSGKARLDASPAAVTTLAAVRAHDKDVNALAVSPNDRLVASASQDKLIKVWHAQASSGAGLLSLAGTCRGHKRGVWAVEFSPVDQCLASASGDKTVKIWSVKDFSCLKTFEGHTASVLGVQFVCAGMQLVSAGADGLLKLWTIKSSECEATLDEHEDKVWALAVAKDGSEMASGGADSTIHLWRDFTEEEERTQQRVAEDKVLKEQQLLNCLRNDQLLDAVQIAFELGHPHRLLQILNDLMEGPRHKDRPDAGEGEAMAVEDALAPVVRSLAGSDEQLKTLLEWLKEWNTNARHSAVCQALLAAMLRELPPRRLQKIEGVARTVDALIAYSERHLQRVDRMLQKSYLVDFSIVSMKNLLPEATPEAASDDEQPVEQPVEQSVEQEDEDEDEENDDQPVVKAVRKKQRV